MTQLTRLSAVCASPAAPVGFEHARTSVPGAVARPPPAWDLAQGVQLVVVFGVGVLHRHPGAELDVLSDGLAKRRVTRHVCRVERLHVEIDEPLALLLGVILSPRCTDMRCANPSSREKRSGPPKDSAVNAVRWST
jgi:hypothetical protein